MIMSTTSRHFAADCGLLMAASYQTEVHTELPRMENLKLVIGNVLAEQVW